MVKYLKMHCSVFVSFRGLNTHLYCEAIFLVFVYTYVLNCVTDVTTITLIGSDMERYQDGKPWAPVGRI